MTPYSDQNRDVTRPIGTTITTTGTATTVPVDDRDSDLGDKALEGTGTGGSAIGASLVLPGIGLVVA